MNRREFIVSGTAFIACRGGLIATQLTDCRDYGLLQQEIDLVRAADYRAFEESGAPKMLMRFPAFQRLEDAFDRMMREVRATTVTDKPAVWFLYNMGVVIKTPLTCFAIDLRHRRGQELAPFLDFALITHNHSDHFTDAFYRAMNSAGKPVISNFKDNYGVKDWAKNGGYTRAAKTFQIADVLIKTALTDHNNYLIDFTSTFEISSHGYTIYHTGDCSNVDKLNPAVTPDLWFVHPYCGMKVADGVRKFHPRTTVVAHLNELGHDRWRWSWQQGLEAKAQVEIAGGKAIVPLWGERI